MPGRDFDRGVAHKALALAQWRKRQHRQLRTEILSLNLIITTVERSISVHFSASNMRELLQPYRHRLHQQGRDLRPAVQGLGRDHAHHRRRPEAPGRQDRHHLFISRLRTCSGM